MVMKFDNETEHRKQMSYIFRTEARKFVGDLSRVVIEGSHGLGNRLERQDESSWTDFKKLA